MEDEKVTVVDRRRFNENDKASSGASEDISQEGVSSVASEQSPPGSECCGECGNESQGSLNTSEVDFSSFVFGLNYQALVLLGEIPHPETSETSINLPAAKQTIDILGMLEEKTKGNLTPTEDKMLSDLLAGVRMVYVKKVRESQ